ncbi:MAG TPA: PocR ligand-binding domain-containing protein [Spirochaetota bacterium]|nr:PocR ligand-binding domain-containing protein [Spirochaetota bacterium]
MNKKLSDSINKSFFSLKDMLMVGSFREILLGLEQVHGLALSLMDAEGNMISVPDARAGCDYCLLNVMFDFGKRCRESDREHMARARETKKTLIYRCYAGMNDIIIPIFYQNYFLGAVITGQIRFARDPLPDFIKLAHGKKTVINKMRRTYKKAPVYNKKHFVKVIKLIENIVNTIILLNAKNLSGIHELEKNKNLNKIQMVQSTKESVEKHFREDINLEMFARRFDMKLSRFSRLFKEYMGKTFREYLLGIRLEEAKRLLVVTDQSVSDIAYNVGFGDSNHFSIIFKKKVGTPPRQFRQKVWQEKNIEINVGESAGMFSWDKLQKAE